MSPADDVRTETLVREPPRRVGQNLRGCLEVNKEIAGIEGRVEVAIATGGGKMRDLVGVVEGGESAEAALDFALAGVEGNP